MACLRFLTFSFVFEVVPLKKGSVYLPDVATALLGLFFPSNVSSFVHS